MKFGHPAEIVSAGRKAANPGQMCAQERPTQANGSGPPNPKNHATAIARRASKETIATRVIHGPTGGHPSHARSRHVATASANRDRMPVDRRMEIAANAAATHAKARAGNNLRAILALTDALSSAPIKHVMKAIVGLLWKPVDRRVWIAENVASIRVTAHAAKDRHSLRSHPGRKTINAGTVPLLQDARAHRKRGIHIILLLIFCLNARTAVLASSIAIRNNKESVPVHGPLGTTGSRRAIVSPTIAWPWHHASTPSGVGRRRNSSRMIDAMRAGRRRNLSITNSGRR